MHSLVTSHTHMGMTYKIVEIVDCPSLQLSSFLLQRFNMIITLFIALHIALLVTFFSEMCIVSGRKNQLTSNQH